MAIPNLTLPARSPFNLRRTSLSNLTDVPPSQFATSLPCAGNKSTERAGREPSLYASRGYNLEQLSFKQALKVISELWQVLPDPA